MFIKRISFDRIESTRLFFTLFKNGCTKHVSVYSNGTTDVHVYDRNGWQIYFNENDSK